MTVEAGDTAEAAEQCGERIVVGVDGSPGARRALDWAIAHVRPHDSIKIVHTWEQPLMAAEGGMIIDPALLADSAEEVLDRELGALRSRHDDLPAIETRAIKGHAGMALLEAARDADLLVVGTRGYGGFAALLLGSTSTYLTHHAPCPLVIVPAPTPRRP